VGRAFHHTTALHGPRARDAERAIDAAFVDRAIDLAWTAAGRTHPNPLVGAVVVRGGQVCGEGCHPAYGMDHAETVALDRAGESARGATLYVTLEPCTHQGKTPPCIHRIIESGVERVVVSTLDPDPRMNGAGIAALREHGITVDVGCGADRAFLLNLRYFKKILGLPPAVTLKMAMTLDGRIASTAGKRDAVSGPRAQRHVHRLRANHDGVLVGINTLIVDRPRLDCRLLKDVASPVPIIVDSSLRVAELGSGWFAGRPFIAVADENVDAAKVGDVERLGGRVIRCPSRAGRIDLRAAIERLDRAGIRGVLVEGGSRVFSSALESDAWDAMQILVAPSLFGPEGVPVADRSLPADSVRGVVVETTVLGRDVLVSYLRERALADLRERLLPKV
jgi:diaminohydroxyphosphoribosylaminopyrimidine deaminase/5-amino-6-(5-phosphoribosylamino)uracil reductase